MGIEATSSSTTVSSSSAAAQTSSAATSDSAKKTSSDSSSFKDEMDKVSKSESKKDTNNEQVNNQVDTNTEKNDKKSSNKELTDRVSDENDNLLFGSAESSIDYSKFGTMGINNANIMLSNDIQQMINNNTAQLSAVAATKNTGSIFSFDNLDSANSISMTQSDAQFFINLTQNTDMSTQNVVAQAQYLLNNGVDAAEVKQNVQISQALLDAINIAKDNNQPLRIDFDQNISVILRINKEGVIAANFIPGDKAVEQYLKNNINSLKATFSENDLPYTDLSYSNSSKQQNERRRNRQQQGE